MRPFLITTVLLLVGTSALAQTVPAPPVPAKPAVKRGAGDAPAIELLDAIKRAEEYAREKKIQLTNHYLQSVVFDIVRRKWALVWQVPRAKGGVTQIEVAEDGAIKVQYGE